jgi:carbonic anhydrase/acetyltransferase-like protein (isoleucine patch superfamily)
MLDSKHRTLVDTGAPPYSTLAVHPEAFVAPSATVVGRISAHPFSSIWNNVVIRCVRKGVRIGHGTNIQDGTVIFETYRDLNVDHDGSVFIGSFTTVGKRKQKQKQKPKDVHTSHVYRCGH